MPEEPQDPQEQGTPQWPVVRLHAVHSKLALIIAFNFSREVFTAVHTVTIMNVRK
jgi:hypothetical protein